MYFRNAIHSLSWGVITAGMSLFFQLFAISVLFPLSASSINIELIDNSLLLLAAYALIEESFKYFIVSKKINILSYGRGFILNAWISGIGFSLFEMFVIYQKNIHANIEFSNLDLVKTSLLHIFTFGIFGYTLGIREKNSFKIGVLIFNFIVHFIYNYSILFLDAYSYYISSAIIIALFVINMFYLIIVNKKLASD
jgi:hypothetical protein